MNYRTVRKRVASLKPSPENSRLYKPVLASDPEVRDLAASIAVEGLHNPLVITADGFVVSGHRRLMALQINEQKQAPCRVMDRRRKDMTDDEYLALLRDHNRQRHKSVEEQVRETLVDINPADAYEAVKRRRMQGIYRDRLNGVKALKILGGNRRSEISPAKDEHVYHIARVVLSDLKDYWPTSNRAVHYGLLNYTFQRNTARKLPYRNDDNCYSATCDLLTRMRVEGAIPWAAITDGTRPSELFQPFQDVKEYIRQEINGLMAGYWRDLQQSQPNQVELLVEKNTVFEMAAARMRPYQIPTTSGRGFSSIDAIYQIARRFRASRKQRLILVVLADFDPEGERIPLTVGETLQGDFGIPAERVEIIKAGVTGEQVKQYRLPAQNFAKVSSTNYQWFVDRTGGELVYELEALKPADMLQDLETTIQGVLDMELFEAEQQREEEEASYLESVRETALEAVRGLGE